MDTVLSAQVTMYCLRLTCKSWMLNTSLAAGNAPKKRFAMYDAETGKVSSSENDTDRPLAKVVHLSCLCCQRHFVAVGFVLS